MTAPGCLDPAHCPVPAPDSVDLRRLRLARLDAGTTLHTVYSRRRWPALSNATGGGHGRFSSISIDGSVIPTMYAARSQTVALLETTFHDVHEIGSRIISEPLQLATRGLVVMSVPARSALVDLTDGGLERVGLDRRQLVTTTPEHYPCTQAWAVALHERRIGGRRADGLLWQSRVAELAQADSMLFADLLPMASEVCVFFGDRVPTEPAEWLPGDPHYEDLSRGSGRLLAEQVAEQLGAVIVPT